MSAQRETIITFSYVTDHDCGNYHMGEVDWGIHGSLDCFIEHYSDKGVKDLLFSMDIVKEQILARWRRSAMLKSTGSSDVARAGS